MPTIVKSGGSIAIGKSVKNGSSGSLLFVDSAGLLAQNNSNLSWNDTTHTLSATNLSGNFNHGSLSGLLNDDHPQYIHNYLSRQINAIHVLNSGIKFPDSNTQTIAYLGPNYSHPAISAASDVTNTNGSVIQSLGLDASGHLISISSTNLDNRYYTKNNLFNAGESVLNWQNLSGVPTYDNYNAWTISDGTNTGSITSARILLVSGVNSTVTYNDGDGTLLVTTAAPSGATSPGGSTTQIQFNDAGSFGGDAGLVYDKNTDTLSIIGSDASSKRLIIRAATSQADNLTEWQNSVSTPIAYIDKDGNIFCQNLTASGLTVAHTTTYINSDIITIYDKNIELASLSGVPVGNDTYVDGGGFTLKSTQGDKTFNWVNATTSWTSSEHLKLASGKSFTTGSGLYFVDGSFQTTAFLSPNQSHPYVVGAANVSNTNGNVLQSITLDPSGHVTTLTSVNLDNRYYTQNNLFNSGESIVNWLNLSGVPTYDNYVSWTISDGTNTGIINSSRTVLISGVNSVSVIYNDSNGLIAISGTSGGSSDHGTLTGLTDDDHPQYVHVYTPRTINAIHTLASGITFPDANTQTVAYLGPNYSHPYIGAASSVNNSNGTVIQDITLDASGHTTGLTSVDLDTRYYTKNNVFNSGEAVINWYNLSGVPTYDNYNYWTLSDGTNSNNISTTNTVLVSGVDSISIVYNTSLGRIEVSGSAGVTDHGLLTGLLDDDHAQYMHIYLPRTINAIHTLSSGIKFSDNNTQTIAYLGPNYSHPYIGAASSVDNSNGVVIQDITLDASGHMTGLTSVDLDNRYYTKNNIFNSGESIINWVNLSGVPTYDNYNYWTISANAITGNVTTGRTISMSGAGIVSVTYDDATGLILASGTSGGAINHNDLLNIDGGTTNQYYHLTLSEYTGTGSGIFVRYSQPSISGYLNLEKNGYYTRLQIGGQTDNITYTLPPTVGTSGNALTTDGLGNLYWIQHSGASTPAGSVTGNPSGVAFFGNDSNIASATNLIWNSGQKNLLINNSAVFFQEYNNGSRSGNINIAWPSGNNQKLTLIGNATLTFTAPLGASRLSLQVLQGSGNSTITWPSGVVWPADVVPTLTTTKNYIDIITFLYDGSKYRGAYALNYSS